jgi:hypothetical protein
VTAITGDQGWIVCAVFNPNTRRTGLWWGRDRKHYPSIETPNPLIWHGPIIISAVDLFVTALHATTSLANNELWLLVASMPYNGSAIPPWGTANPDLTYFTLPLVGSPLSDLSTAGLHRYASGAGLGNWQPYSRLESLATTGGDKAARKIVYQDAVGSRGLEAASGTGVTVYSRSDPATGAASWGTGTNVAVSPVQTISPAVEVAGHKLQYRIDFFAPQGGATPPKVPIVDSFRRAWWRVVSSFRVLLLEVSFGDRVPGRSGAQSDVFDPELTLERLKALTESGRTVLRVGSDRRYACKLRQVLDTTYEQTDGPYGVRATTKLQVAVLEAL